MGAAGTTRGLGRGRGASNNREPLAAFATTIAEDFAAAAGGLTGAITDLAGSLFAMRAACEWGG